MRKGGGITVVLGGGPSSKPPMSKGMGPMEDEGEEEEYADSEGENAAAMRVADALGIDATGIDVEELKEALRDFVQTCC